MITGIVSAQEINGEWLVENPGLELSARATTVEDAQTAMESMICKRINKSARLHGLPGDFYIERSIPLSKSVTIGYYHFGRPWGDVPEHPCLGDVVFPPKKKMVDSIEVGA